MQPSEENKFLKLLHYLSRRLRLIEELIDWETNDSYLNWDLLEGLRLFHKSTQRLFPSSKIAIDPLREPDIFGATYRLFVQAEACCERVLDSPRFRGNDESLRGEIELCATFCHKQLVRMRKRINSENQSLYDNLRRDGEVNISQTSGISSTELETLLGDL